MLSGALESLIPNLLPKIDCFYCLVQRNRKKCLSHKDVSEALASPKDHFSSTAPSKTYPPHHPPPNFSSLLFPPLTLVLAPWNPLVSPFNTSAPCALCPALPDLLFLTPAPSLPVVTGDLSPSMILGALGELRAKSNSMRCKKPLETGWVFPSFKWTSETPDVHLVCPPSLSWNLVYSLHWIAQQGKGHLGGLLHKYGKDASARRVRKLLQFAPSASNTIFVKCKSEARIRVSSFIRTSEFCTFAYA